MPLSLSQKERMLLQDQKSHEELCIDKYSRYANEAQDPQLKKLFNTHATHEQQHLNTINQILSGQTPTSTGQGQSAQGAASTQAGQAAPQAQQAMPNTGFNKNDAALANDMLTTEKYISGTYDTVIFECTDSNVRQALNHIQKEEQQHGEDLFKYMQSHGMYTVH